MPARCSPPASADQSTVVTELVYRKQIRPVLQTGATAMDRIFGPLPGTSHAGSHSEQQERPSVDPTDGRLPGFEVYY